MLLEKTCLQNQLVQLQTEHTNLTDQFNRLQTDHSTLSNQLVELQASHTHLSEQHETTLQQLVTKEERESTGETIVPFVNQIPNFYCFHGLY